MPILDLSLEELKEYRGLNPRPADHDEFWDRGLEEMRSCDPKTELVPAPFRAGAGEFFDLYFNGTGGARIHAKYGRPGTDRTRHPAVLLFHGYSGDSGSWTGLLPFMSQGYSVLSMDCRGQGGHSEDTGGIRGTTLRGHIIRGLDDKPENLLFRHIFLDCAKMASIAMELPEVDPGRVGVTGGSQGGGLTLACAALEPGIRKAAPVFPFLCDYRRVWEMDLAKKAYEELAYFFRSFDPLHEKEDEIFTRLGYIDVQFLAPRIKADVLFAVGLQDDICPPSSQFAAFNRISSPKQLLVYPDFGHENLKGHDDRIFSFLADL